MTIKRSEVELKTYKELANMDEQLIRTVYGIVDGRVKWAEKRNVQRRADGLPPAKINADDLRIHQMIKYRNIEKQRMRSQGDPNSIPLDAFGRGE